jgi:hypothetical protein
LSTPIEKEANNAVKKQGNEIYPPFGLILLGFFVTVRLPANALKKVKRDKTRPSRSGVFLGPDGSTCMRCQRRVRTVEGVKVEAIPMVPWPHALTVPSTLFSLFCQLNQSTLASLRSLERFPLLHPPVLQRQLLLYMKPSPPVAKMSRYVAGEDCFWQSGR